MKNMMSGAPYLISAKAPAGTPTTGADVNTVNREWHLSTITKIISMSQGPQRSTDHTSQT